MSRLGGVPELFQNAVLTRIDAAMEALESLAWIAQDFRHAGLLKIANNAYNALQDAKMQGQRYIGPSFVCERCKGAFRGDGRHYPGSHLADQPAMKRVCDFCERALIDAAARALIAAPRCRDCGQGKAAYDGVRCWPCNDKAERAQSAPGSAEPGKPIPPASEVPDVRREIKGGSR